MDTQPGKPDSSMNRSYLQGKGEQRKSVVEVSDDVMDLLIKRAELVDMSVSEYLERLMSDIERRPSMTEIVERAKYAAENEGGGTVEQIQKIIEEGRNR